MDPMEPEAPLSGFDLLKKIRGHALHAGRQQRRPLFERPELEATGREVDRLMDDGSEPRDPEWRAFRRTVGDDGRVGVSPEELQQFRDLLGRIEATYLRYQVAQHDEALEELTLLGQGLLRRRYLALLMRSGEPAPFSRAARLIAEAGAAAIQALGRAPTGPHHPYRYFRTQGRPHADALGIEILTSGAFPDRQDPETRAAVQQSGVTGIGFENVMTAAFDTPRSRVLARALREGKRISPKDLPLFNRMMLDLELMRLGQATTPGTFTMLLDAHYQGAGIADHSTNVSEQVQVIHAEEEWAPTWSVGAEGELAVEAQAAADCLLHRWFRFADDSPIGRDHPRTARVQFSSMLEPERIGEFLRLLRKALRSGGVARCHRVVPVLDLRDSTANLEPVTTAILTVKRAGYRELALVADVLRPYPGLLQYFATAEQLDSLLAVAKQEGVQLTDGRSVDQVATANKTVEATAGAIQSGQGCIKVGLLGLTLEQMKPFIGELKKALGYYLRRDQHRRLVFIAIVDEPLVGKDRVFTDPFEIATAFIDLMRRTHHNILLLDTMHKGAAGKRLVDAGDGKGGHLSEAQLRELVRSARAPERAGGCDLWVAGSYTEEQVYRTAREPPETRPGLICLGGAERSFGGIRLEPRDAYAAGPRDRDGKVMQRLIEIHGDIKHFLSRENKLARDAGQVVGELARRERGQEAQELDELRGRYLKIRQAFLDELKASAEPSDPSTGNLDLLMAKTGTLGDTGRGDALATMRSRFQELRGDYVERVSQCMYELYASEWFGGR